MTLVLGTGVSGNFVSMSSDKRRVTMKYWYYPETGQYEKVQGEPLEIEDGDHIKVEKISSLALMGHGGTASLGTYLKDELIKIVNEDDDLKACKKKLELVIKKARTENTEDRIFNLLDQENGVLIMIMGFYKDNSTGLVSFEAGEGSEVTEKKAPKGFYQYAICPPVQIYSEQASLLFMLTGYEPVFLDEDFMTLEGKEEEQAWRIACNDKMMWIHNLISTTHPVEVSSDGITHTLKLDDNGIVHHEVVEFDTKEETTLA